MRDSALLLSLAARESKVGRLAPKDLLTDDVSTLKLDLLVDERDEFFVLVLGGVENDDLPPLNEDRPPLNDDLLPLKDDPPPLDRPPLKRCAGAIEGNVSDTINK
jgi:hypothetical protein